MTPADILPAVVAALLGLAVGWLLRTRRTASELQAAEVRAARAQAELDAARAGHEERLRASDADRDRLAAQFRALASDALSANNAQFLGLAEQRLRTAQVAGQAALAQREDAVRALVDPLVSTLDRVQRELADSERARAAGDAAIAEQLRGMREASDLLRLQTGDLVTALRSSQVRGAWGELQLRRVVEAAGMLRHVDFVEQGQVSTDDGALRPDLVVRLAGGKNVVVDAKVAFLGYLEAQQATDPAVRAERLAAHARHLRKHVDDLAGKRYWDQFSPAPEFVVMFVPAEAFLSAALETDSALLEYAVQRNVIIATPMSLVALLRTIAYTWRQEAVTENAQRVLTLGKELHGRLATMGSHLARLGRQIQGATDAYNGAVASLETRVLVSARRFADLQVVDAELPGPPPVTRRVTGLSAPELIAGDGSATRQQEGKEDQRADPEADHAHAEAVRAGGVAALGGVDLTRPTADLAELVESEERRVHRAAGRGPDATRAAG